MYMSHVIEITLTFVDLLVLADVHVMAAKCFSKFFLFSAILFCLLISYSLRTLVGSSSLLLLYLAHYHHTLTAYRIVGFFEGKKFHKLPLFRFSRRIFSRIINIIKHLLITLF